MIQKTLDGRRLLKTVYVLPNGYRIDDLMNNRYLLIRVSDGNVIARVDDLELLLKRLDKENFVMSIYEHDEWEALEAFYSYCYWMAHSRKRLIAEQGAAGKTASPLSVTDRQADATKK